MVEVKAAVEATMEIPWKEHAAKKALKQQATASTFRRYVVKDDAPHCGSILLPTLIAPTDPPLPSHPKHELKKLSRIGGS
jgi:hypothetical protein